MYGIVNVLYTPFRWWPVFPLSVRLPSHSGPTSGEPAVRGVIAREGVSFHSIASDTHTTEHFLDIFLMSLPPLVEVDALQTERRHARQVCEVLVFPYSLVVSKPTSADFAEFPRI